MTMRFGLRLGLAGLLAACFVALLPGAAGVTAQEPGAAMWQAAPGAGDGAYRLYTPASGALFANGLFSGLRRSNDGGRTWRPVPLVALPEKRISSDVPEVAVDFDPTNHAVAYHGGGDGLYKTTDNGLTWHKTLAVSGTIFQVAVSPADPRVVYFALETPGRSFQLWRSRDGATTWEQAVEMAGPTGGECVWGASIFYPHPTDAARLFLQASCGGSKEPGQTPVLGSDDQGEHWSPTFEQPASFGGTLVGGRGADPSRFYLFIREGGYQGGYALLRSDDGARTWATTYRVPPPTWVYSMAYDPEAPNRVYLDHEVSEDGGTTWQRLPTEGLQGDTRELQIGIDRRRLYAATTKGVFWLPLKADGSPPAEGEAAPSIDEPSPTAGAALPAGTTWSLMGQAIQSKVIERLFPPTGQTIFARGHDGALYRSDDAGVAWATVDAPTATSSKTVEVDPTDPATMYVNGTDGLYKTENNARTWRQVLPTKDTIHSISVSPADHALVYISVGSGPSRLMRSRDGGQSWESLQEARRAPPNDPQGCGWWTHLLMPHPTDPSRVFASTGCYQAGADPWSGLRQSVDQGQTWADLFSERNSFPTRMVGGRGAAPNRWYTLAGSRLLRSDDDGASWREILVNGLSAVAYDASNPDRVFAGLRGAGLQGAGVLASSDGGATWTDLGAVGESHPVYDLALGEDGRSLYAGTHRGVWRLGVSP
jgi:photosystem II stability/assembly factor-like uncharacterized protein